VLQGLDCAHLHYYCNAPRVELCPPALLDIAPRVELCPPALSGLLGAPRVVLCPLALDWLEVFCHTGFPPGRFSAFRLSSRVLGFIKETFYFCTTQQPVLWPCGRCGFRRDPSCCVLCVHGSFAGWFSQVALLFCCLIWLLCAPDHCLICLISAVLLLLSAYGFSLCARGEHQGGGMQLLRDHPLLVPTLPLGRVPSQVAGVGY